MQQHYNHLKLPFPAMPSLLVNLSTCQTIVWHSTCFFQPKLNYYNLEQVQPHSSPSPFSFLSSNMRAGKPVFYHSLETGLRPVLFFLYLQVDLSFSAIKSYERCCCKRFPKWLATPEFYNISKAAYRIIKERNLKRQQSQENQELKDMLRGIQNQLKFMSNDRRRPLPIKTIFSSSQLQTLEQVFLGLRARVFMCEHQ